MPVEPHVLRATPRGVETALDDPVPVVLILRRGGGGKVESVPGLKLAEAAGAGEEPNAILVRWGFQPGGRETLRQHEDWFRASDVLDHWPLDPGEWERIVKRPVWAF